jgi:hypothetical protein
MKRESAESRQNLVLSLSFFKPAKKLLTKPSLCARIHLVAAKDTRLPFKQKRDG